MGMTQTAHSSPWLPQGTVYGTLMNFACEHAALAAQMLQPPYKAAPQAPVLYIKTANTFSAHGSAVLLPAHVPQVQVRASVGLIFHTNKALDESNDAQAAINTIANVVLLNDLTIPHASFYRPPVKFKCMDGFLCAGPLPHAAPDAAALDTLTVTVRVNGQVVQTFNTANMVRKAAQLAEAVSEFIDMQEGDVLMLGSPFDAPLARAGDTVEISAPGFATLRHTLVQSTAQGSEVTA
jgi:5-oxopent-3-ene-1,2,5-tricarboxylate decarboxylase / 2-hydroxyhepta-2,4-diene-1,7-dioate isomerase